MEFRIEVVIGFRDTSKAEKTFLLKCLSKTSREDAGNNMLLNFGMARHEILSLGNVVRSLSTRVTADGEVVWQRTIGLSHHEKLTSLWFFQAINLDLVAEAIDRHTAGVPQVPYRPWDVFLRPIDSSGQLTDWWESPKRKTP